MEQPRIPFTEFLRMAFLKGDYTTDDVIAFALRLFREVLRLHEIGLVAPFDHTEALFVTGGVLHIDQNLAHTPTDALYRVRAEANPVYLPGYRCFEQLLGHH